MPFVNTALLTKGLRGEFIQAFVGAPTVLPKLATVAPSDKSSETYGWLGDVPAMREFVDERVVGGFTDTSYTITNKTWESTIDIKRSEIEDDQTKKLPVRINDLAARAKQHADELLYTALVNGTTENGYDAYDFFGTAHPIRGKQTATQSNLLTGTGTTVAALKEDFKAALAAMKNFKDEHAKPFFPGGIMASGLIAIVPPGIEFEVREALNSTLINNTSNALQGAVGEVLVSPWFSDTNDWYLLYTAMPVKPLIFQDRVGIEFSQMLWDNETGFLRETGYFGVRGRYNVGYGLWQCAVKTTNA